MTRIKNIKVSYPTEYNNKLWEGLYTKRDKLLRFSDFAVLDDSELTEDCVSEWKRWRKSLRLLTREKFKTVGAATKMLRDIHSLMPKKEYIQKIESEVSVIDEIEFNEIKERLKEAEGNIVQLVSVLKKMRKETSDKLPSEPEALQEHLMKMCRTWYNHQFELILDAPMLVVMERCEQAIDYKVGDDIDSSPLVSNYMKVSNMTAEQVSDKFINDKKKLMDSISSLDKKVWNIRLQIKHTSEIDALNRMAKELTVD